MPRFFIENGQIGVKDNGVKTAIIFGDDALHITKSLRMRAGEGVTLCDANGTEYICEIISLGESVTVEIKEERMSKSEPPYKATVYQALVKGDKFDTVVQKSVECGAFDIVPFSTERSIVRLDKKDSSKKVARWQKIAEEAAKQCGRGIIPKVHEVMSFKEAIEAAAKADIPLFCYEAERGKTLPEALKGKNPQSTVSFAVGSEGGFSPAEVEYAIEKGMISVGLGTRILRTETAPVFALSCLSYEFELH